MTADDEQPIRRTKSMYIKEIAKGVFQAIVTVAIIFAFIMFHNFITGTVDDGAMKTVVSALLYALFIGGGVFLVAHKVVKMGEQGRKDS